MGWYMQSPDCIQVAYQQWLYAYARAWSESIDSKVE